MTHELVLLVDAGDGRGEVGVGRVELSADDAELEVTLGDLRHVSGWIVCDGRTVSSATVD